MKHRYGSCIRRFCLLLLICLLPMGAGAEAAEPEAADVGSTVSTAREQMIDEILEAAHGQFVKTKGRLQRAHYSGDIYICKNFTIYCFKQAAPHYRMAEYPDTALVIPDNLPKEECKTYLYGYKWKDIPAEKGNPFYEAAAFRYDPNLSKKENQEIARAFLRQVQRGDFFQMRADYYYGKGPHSLIFTQDYDAASDTVTWCDSNMKGEKKSGIRYGCVQWDANRNIDWFVDAFCRSRHGATLYRLREDIVSISNE